MSRRRPIPLFPNPPYSPHRNQDKSSPSVAYSDFPPYRILDTPPPAAIQPALPAAIQSAPLAAIQPAAIQPQPRSSVQKNSQPQHGRMPKKGLGQKNCVNTIHSKASAKRTKTKLPLKRGIEALDVSDDRPSKKTCIVCVEEEDFDSLMGEIKYIRETLDQFSREMDHRLGNLFYKVQQLS